MVLRNAVPRQGTETIQLFCLISEEQIEKCSSPTGDGNIFFCLRASSILLRNAVPRQGTETFLLFSFVMYLDIIEKCSFPTGDGNNIQIIIYSFFDY